jgi:RimJ/RimL family protein N-acetyltransferase
MNIIFETTRLYLRELALSDINDLSQVLCNTISMKYYPRAFTITEVEQWIVTNINRYSIYGYGLWGVVLKDTDKLIGDCGVTIQQIDNEFLPEIGFHINQDYCRNGYATEAGRKTLSYCNIEYKLKRIYSYCNRENIPSQNTMLKIGMQYHKHYYQDGSEKVVYVKIF